MEPGEVNVPQPQSALVIGSSGGIGEALCALLESRGCVVTRLSRREHGLDLTDEDTIAAAAARLRDAGAAFDWIFDATGVLAVDGVDPERAFRQLDPAVMLRSFAINAMGPALLLKHFAELLHRGRPVAFATLSARLGSIGDNRLGGWMSYRASKAALNQYVRSAAVEIARRRPEAVVVSLHPGTVETEMSRAYARGRYTASASECAEQLVTVLAALTPAETGGFFAYDGQAIPF